MELQLQPVVVMVTVVRRRAVGRRCRWALTAARAWGATWMRSGRCSAGMYGEAGHEFLNSLILDL